MICEHSTSFTYLYDREAFFQEIIQCFVFVPVVRFSYRLDSLQQFVSQFFHYRSVKLQTIYTVQIEEG